MKHPDESQLSCYLYEELNRQETQEIARHLQVCEECAGKLARMQQVATTLDDWAVPQRGQTPQPGRSAGKWIVPFRWAAAAVILLCAGVLLGRVSQPSMNQEELKRQVKAEVRSGLERELITQVSTSLQTQWRQELATALTQDRERLSEAVTLALQANAIETLEASQGRTEQLLTGLIGEIQRSRKADRARLQFVLGELENRIARESGTLEYKLTHLAQATGQRFELARDEMIRLAGYQDINENDPEERINP